MADGPEMGHAGHDPHTVAALLERDLPESGRTVAGALVATCPECAALHADLLVLSSAIHALPSPPRTADYRLTAGDAARLSAATRAEPDARHSRLDGVMNDTHGHAGHDTLLVATLADHSPAGPERDRATALVESCTLCAGLHEDLVALSAATKAMPTPPRPHAYTLRPATAAQLRPGGWRRFIAGIGTARDGFSRPLALGLTTLGLAGLLVATVPSILTGSAGAAPAATSAQAATGAQAAAGAVPPAIGGSSPADSSKSVVGLPESPPAMAADLASSAPYTTRGGAAASSAPGAEAGGASEMPVRSPDHGVSTRIGEAENGDLANVASKASVADDRGGLSTMILVSSTMLLVGLGLFAFRWRARHLGVD